MRLAIVFGLMAFWIACQAQAESLVVEDRPPRSFGYVIGDTLERHITVTAPRALQLHSARSARSRTLTPLSGSLARSASRIR